MQSTFRARLETRYTKSSSSTHERIDVRHILPLTSPDSDFPGKKIPHMQVGRSFSLQIGEVAHARDRPLHVMRFSVTAHLPCYYLLVRYLLFVKSNFFWTT